MKHILYTVCIVLLAFSAKAQCTVDSITGATTLVVGATTSLSDTSTGGTWSSSDTTIAFIDPVTGAVTGRGTGVATITYSLSGACSGYYATSIMQVSAGFIGRTKLCISDTATLQNSISGIGDWASSDPTVASVSSTTGLVTALTAGFTIITHSFTTSGVSYVASDTVKVASVTSVGTLTGPSVMCNWNNITLTCAAAVTWTSLSALATVVSSTPYTANIRAVNPGTGKIMYTSEYCRSVKDSFTLTINVSPTGVIVPAAPCISGSGYTSICAGSMRPVGISAYGGISGYWTSSDTSIAQVSGAYGSAGCFGAYVTAMHPPANTSVYIYFTGTNAAGCSATSGALFTINATPAPVDTISGGAYPVTGAAATYSSTAGYGVWSVSPASVATISGSGTPPYNGTLHGVGLGTATITHTVTNSCGVSITYDTVLVMPSAYTAVCPTFSTFVTRLCAGPQFGISLPPHTSVYHLVTHYGDGQIDTTNVAASPALALTTFGHVFSTSGFYTMKQILYDGSTALDSVIYSYQHFLCHDIAVSFFDDDNGDCVFDSTTEQLNHSPIIVEVDSSGIPKDTLSVTSGFYYQSWGNTGDIYSFRSLSVDSPFYFSCPASGTVYDTVLATGTGTINKYIGLACSGDPGFDLILSTTFQAGRHMARGSIELSNPMCTPQNAVVTLNISPQYTFDWAYPLPSSIVGNTVTWDFTGVDVNSIPQLISYGLSIPTSTWLLPGDTIHTTISVSPVIGDVNPSNNVVIRIDTVKSSYDPNHVEALPQGYVLNGTKLHYTVQFENDGNDTAHNIYVMDTLSDMLNCSTFRLEGSSADINITKIRAGGHNIIRFEFPNIMLPDSSHHGKCTGQVSYCIQPDNMLPDGTEILAHAGIFFDDNPVVLTDTAYNKIVIPDISIAADGGDTICNGNAVHFSAAAHTIDNTHYQWFVNALVAGTDSAGFTLSAAMEGDVVACVITSTNDTTMYVMSDSVVLINRGVPLPASISGLSAVCVGADIILSSSLTTGVWNTSNANLSFTGGVAHGISAGVDTVSYSITNVCGTAVTNHIVAINPLPFAGSISGATSVCEGSSISISDTASGGSWSSSNGSLSLVDGFATGNYEGTDTISYTVTNSCGTNVTTHVIAINTIPYAGSIAGPSVVCAGVTVTLSDTASGGVWGVVNVHASVTASGVVHGLTFGSDTVKYTFTNACGTSVASHAMAIDTFLSPGSVFGATALCGGVSATLSATVAGGTWSSSNAYATVVSGVVTGISGGIDTILYSFSNDCGVSSTSHIVTVTSASPTSVTIAASPGSAVCSGIPVTFTASGTNPGPTPFYEWKLSGVNVGTGTVYTYTPTTGDIISCEMASSADCAIPDTAVSANITMLVYNLVTPSISISLSASDSVAYLGEIVNVFSAPTFGGSSPTYQWYLNGVAVFGATNSSYAPSVNSNDTIYCVMTSDASCVASAIDTSNTIILYADYLGIQDIKNPGDLIKIFPNPTTGQLNINGITSKTLFRIVDITGVTLSQGVLEQVENKISIDDIADGVYILELTNDKGQRTDYRLLKG